MSGGTVQDLAGILREAWANKNTKAKPTQKPLEKMIADALRKK